MTNLCRHPSGDVGIGGITAEGGIIVTHVGVVKWENDSGPHVHLVHGYYPYDAKHVAEMWAAENLDPRAEYTYTYIGEEIQ